MAKCYRTKKTCFTTRVDADIDRARIEMNSAGHRRMAYREVPSRSYKCEFCGHWHHTSQTKDEGNESRHTL